MIDRSHLLRSRFGLARMQRTAIANNVRFYQRQFGEYSSCADDSLYKKAKVRSRAARSPLSHRGALPLPIPMAGLHFGSQGRCCLLEVSFFRALCPSEKIADVSFLPQDKCQTGTHHDRSAISHSPQNQGCTTSRPLTLIVFLLCCFRTHARNAQFACADGKNPRRLSSLRLAYGRVPTYFHLSQLHPI
jgi:hypothetical protein